MNMNKRKQYSVPHMTKPKARLPLHDQSRASLDGQIKAVKANIKDVLRQIKSLVHAGKWDEAARKCALVTRNRETLVNLARAYTKRMNDEPDQDKPAAYRPRTKTVHKVKRYRSIMDGAKASKR